MSSDSQLRLEPLPVPRTYDLEVVSVEDWTATLRRIVLRAPELRDLD